MVDADRAAEPARAALSSSYGIGHEAIVPIWRWLRACAEIDAPRLALWTPAALGAGAVSYLLSPQEPVAFAAPLVAAAVAMAAFRAERMRAPLLSLLAFLAGFIAAQLRVMAVDAPALTREIRYADIQGRLISIDEAPRLRKLVIEIESIDQMPSAQLPARARISWRGEKFEAKPGDVVAVRATLAPPPSPVAPGGFDFARQLYFQRIGAVGYAVSIPKAISGAHRGPIARLAGAIEDLRIELVRRILDKAPGEGGTIVAAVVTGKRGAIPGEVEAAFRDSGLAHLLSISGLHMGLATGLVFFGVRALLAMVESVALKRPIKKWAAAAALISGAGYLVISGAAWPAQRAYIMSSIFFLAILFDRRALSLRNVAIAAVVIILMTPEAVLHPGFQMSFAAVTALIAAYEWASRRASPYRSYAIPAKLRRYVVGIAATDTIAAAATAPFSLYHFSRTANFGLPANIVSIPIMAFWVMPAAIVAVMLAPFDLDAWFWRAAASGVDVMLLMARWTMSLPGAVTVFPQWPPAALGVLTIGGLWLCLMAAPWRLLGLAALPVAAALIASEPHAILYVSDDGDNVGYVRLEEGRTKTFGVYTRARSRFDAEVWMEQAGLDIARMRALMLKDIAPCDNSGCVIEHDGAVIAVSARRSALDDDCARATLVIALFAVSDNERRNCAAQLLDRRDAWRKGSHAVFVRNGEIMVRSAAGRRGDRPWTSRHD